MSDDVCISTLDCKLQNVLVDGNLLDSIKSINKKITEILWITSNCIKLCYITSTR